MCVGYVCVMHMCMCVHMHVCMFVRYLVYM